MRALATALLSLYLIAELSSAQYLSLAGNEWTAINANKSNFIQNFNNSD